MENQFEMLLPNVRKSRQIVWSFVGIYFLAWAAWLAMMLNYWTTNKSVHNLLFCLIMAMTASLIVFSWLLRRLAYDPHVLVVTSDELRVENRESGETRSFPFGDIARFRVNAYRGSVGLWFWNQEGKKLNLNSNNDDLLQVVPALKKALSRYEQAQGLPAAFRPVSYFGHPVSTVFLWLYVALLVVLARVVMQESETSGATAFLWMLGLGFIPYALGWYEAREERRNY